MDTSRALGALLGGVAVIAAARGAQAQVKAPSPGPADHYAHGSTSLTGSFEVEHEVFTGAFEFDTVSAGVGTRLVNAHGLVLEPIVGAAWTASTSLDSAVGGINQPPAFVLRTGLLVGWAHALARTVAVTMLAGYTLDTTFSAALTDPITGANVSPFAHRLGAQIGFEIFLTRNVFIEPTVSVVGIVASNSFRLGAGTSTSMGFTF